jgi:purine-binding chemotaxis protein CheW
MSDGTETIVGGGTDGLVSIRVGSQNAGVPVLKVQDVIAQKTINRVPISPPEVAGSLNLRGRIVTAIDMRIRLKMEPRAPEATFMAVIVEHGHELYALIVDEVYDVLWLKQDDYEPSPVTLPPHWRAVCSGVYRLESGLLAVLDVDQVLDLSGDVSQAA